MEISISDHAIFEAKRRGISINTIWEIASRPQQKITSTSGRTICQSKLFDPILGQEMLFRVIIEDEGNIRYVVTVYKTSKIGKYWEEDD